MKVSNSYSKINKIIDSRYKQIFSLPKDWQEDDFILDSNFQYSIGEEIEIPSISTFGAKEMVVKILKNEEKYSTCFNLENKELVRATCYNSKKGFNYIQIGNIKVCEHILALQQIGLNLSYCISENNFPCFGNLKKDLLDNLKEKIIKIGESDYISVKSPLIFEFENGTYFLIEPDNGEKKLILDHQISYKNILGTQRIVYELTPESFAYLLKARTPAYYFRTKIAKILLGYFSHIPGLGFSYDNVVFVDENKILNPRDDFEHNGKNYEIILHEIVDKLGALSLLKGGKFVGKITTLYTSHKKDIDVMNYLEYNNLLKKV